MEDGLVWLVMYEIGFTIYIIYRNFADNKLLVS